MSPETVGVIGIVIMLALFFLGMPVGAAFIIAGFVGFGYIGGMEEAYSVLSMSAYRTSTTYMLTVIPLFILMGILAAHSGLSGDAFYSINRWVGHLPGGLAMATVGGCTAFGAVCGSAMAAAVTMCSAALPEMRRYHYKDELSLGCIAAGGNLSFLIPPSIAFIIYAILTELSIGTLFIAGILPGILMALLFVITIFIQCRLSPSLASAGPKASWGEQIRSLRLVWGFVVLILLVLGGIYGGVFTPTEAAAIGVFGTAVLGLIKRKLSWHVVTESIKETTQLTGMIFLLIIGAIIFSTFMTVTELPLVLANFIVQLAVSPWVILGIVLIFFIIMGFIFEIMAVILLAIPILHPVLVSLGFDPIWLGVLTIITVVMGNISPPFGIIVFAIGGAVKEVPLFTIFRGALPFLAAMAVGLILVIIFPEIALLLPNLMK